nr:recombinase family protein [Providencia rettgeri]ELR5080242.1 recombinase family protein [Providencia rettgeri]
MIFGYVRVSTKEQNIERQTDVLTACDKIFIDRVSAKSADRPELNAMRQQLRDGDTVRVKSVDRLARNTQDGTVAKLAMRQPFVLFKGLTFQKLCLPGAFRPGDHHNKMLRPGLCVVHASPQYL